MHSFQMAGMVGSGREGDDITTEWEEFRCEVLKNVVIDEHHLNVCSIEVSRLGARSECAYESPQWLAVHECVNLDTPIEKRLYPGVSLPGNQCKLLGFSMTDFKCHFEYQPSNIFR